MDWKYTKMYRSKAANRRLRRILEDVGPLTSGFVVPVASSITDPRGHCGDSMCPGNKALEWYIDIGEQSLEHLNVLAPTHSSTRSLDPCDISLIAIVLALGFVHLEQARFSIIDPVVRPAHSHNYQYCLFL